MRISDWSSDVCSSDLDFDDQFRILESAIYARLRGQLLGKVANGGAGLKKGETVSSLVLDGLPKKEWFNLRMKDEDASEAIERASMQIEAHQKEFERRDRKSTRLNSSR